MQVDEHNPAKNYGAWNQSFLQMIMSRGFMTGQDVFKGVKEIYERFKSNPKFPSMKMDTSNNEDMADLIEWFLNMANQNLEKDHIPLRIKITYEESKSNADARTYQQYYVLVPESQDEGISKMQKNFGEPELEWLRLVADYLIESEDRLSSPNELTNLCRNGGNNAAKKKLTVSEADRAMNIFVEEGYLQKVGSGKRTKLGLGPRFMAEMETWLEEEERPEGVWKCGKGGCDKVGMVGTQCTKRDCKTYFHLYHGIPKCSRCKTPLAGLGEPIKRSR